jgi:UDP-N-acetylglucosamine 2-epimerase (non-hydrolysing)
MLRTIICVVGTRPEAIKMVPVIRALEASTWARCVVVATAQHREMLDQMLQRFNVVVDYDLNLMRANQGLNQLLACMLPELDNIIKKEKPYALIAQGDTTTVCGSALAAFNAQIPFGHVEAGLRTYNLKHPFPEEGYRQMVSRITYWHFAPTIQAAENLKNEGIDPNKIYVTGNTCIDTLLQTVSEQLTQEKVKKRTILLTAHRRENFGQPLINIFTAILEILKKYPDVDVLYPVHPNPNVQKLAYEMFGDQERVRLCKPLDYFDFVAAMQDSYIILTDSGGVQEEAPSLKKPVLVLRETTERLEAVNAGTSLLVGSCIEKIVQETSRLLDDKAYYASMQVQASPFGEGNAGKKIINKIASFK